LHTLPLHAIDGFSEGFEIRYFPSLEMVIELNKREFDKSRSKLLVVEPPNTDSNLTNSISRKLNSLYSEDQIVYMPMNQVTRKNVCNHIRQTDFHTFQFLGHAECDMKSPLDSVLRLQGLDEISLKYILNQKDLFEGYKLVCLTACETGLTSSELINEFIGLSHGILATGACSVISTLWQVEESATVLIMGKFYEELASGTREISSIKILNSLEKAKRWLRELERQDLINLYQNDPILASFLPAFPRLFLDSEEKPYSHPYFWSGFTLTGR
jgi:CHAT domain-containing protein